MPMLPATQNLKGFEALLSRSFGVPSGRSFYDDFPVWDPKRAVLGVWRFGSLAPESNGRDPEPLACALLREARLRLPSANPLSRPTLRVGLIGGVCTDTSHRGRGLASALVQEAIEKAKALSLELLLLWGSEHSLYERLGFSLAGHQIRILLQSVNDCAMSPDSPIAGGVAQGWHPAIFELMRQRPDGLEIEPSDLNWLSQHRNVQWWRWEAPEGGMMRTLAYAAIDRGIDLHDFVHEWGGAPIALRHLLRQIGVERPAAWLLAPAHSEGRLLLPALPSDAITERLALVKPLTTDAKRVLNSLWVWGLDAC